jgi:hypothetical protein
MNARFAPLLKFGGPCADSSCGRGMARKTEGAQNVVAALLGASTLALLLAVVSVATRALGPAVPGARLIPPRALAPAVGKATSAPPQIAEELPGSPQTTESSTVPLTRVVGPSRSQPAGETTSAPPVPATSASPAPSAPAPSSPPPAGDLPATDGGDAVGTAPPAAPSAQTPQADGSDETRKSRRHGEPKKGGGRSNEAGGSPQSNNQPAAPAPAAAEPATLGAAAGAEPGGPEDGSPGNGASDSAGGRPEGPGPHGPGRSD